MIEIISSWAKNIVLAIIVISILEMLLPNNKTKKYVKMVMGLYLLFNIISPFIQNKDKINISEFNLEEYMNNTQEVSTNVNQESMDKRLNEIYVEELEKDIKKKLANRGYTVTNCNIVASIDKEGKSTGIENITLRVEKNIETNDETISQENNEEKATINEDSNQDANKNSNTRAQSEDNNGAIESTLVKEIQKIKDIKIGDKENENDNGRNSQEKSEEDEQKISNTDVKKIKQFLVEEYEVNEKCLKIN